MRFLPLTALIAARNVKASRSGFISFVAWISVSGLVLGVAALIVVLSVMNGFEQAMKDKILGVVPHIQITAPYMIENWQPKLNEIKSSHKSIEAVVPILNTQIMVMNNKSDTTNKPAYVLTLNGIEPDYEKNISFLAKNIEQNQGMIKGSLDSLRQPNHIVIGETLAKELKVNIGDELPIILVKSNDSQVGITPISHRLTVSGIFRLSHQTEQYIALSSIDTVGEILDLPSGVQGFKVRLNEVFLAPTIAKDLADKNPKFYVYQWMQTHGTIYETLQLQRNLSGLLLFLIILVAIFNLVSSLVMTVTDKQADIAILKTMGATPSMIKGIFVWQGLMISAVGTVIGAVIGLLIASNIGWLSSWVNHTFELDLFDNYFVTELPSNIYASDVFFIVVISIVIGVLATLYPAHQAAKISPAQALRYE